MLISLSTAQLFAQQAPVPVDTILMLSGKKIPAKVASITSTTIYYTDIEFKQPKQVERKNVEKIFFRSGRVEVYNKPVMTAIDETNWKAVLVTENPQDVDGLYKRGEVKASSGSSSRSMKAAKQNALIKLQKRTAGMRGNIVLITKSEAIGGYGDYPAYNLEGIAYGFEPLDISSVPATRDQAQLPK